MTKHNNHSGDHTESSAVSGGLGVIIGAILVIITLIVIVVLTLPYIRAQMDSITNTEPTVNVVLPEIPENISVSEGNATVEE